MTDASFIIDDQDGNCDIIFSGDWQLGRAPAGEDVCTALSNSTALSDHTDLSNKKNIKIITDNLTSWDSSLPIAVLALMHWGEERQLAIDISAMPEGLQNLLHLALEVPATNLQKPTDTTPLLERFSRGLEAIGTEVSATFIFIGDTCVAFKQWLSGRAKTRRSDIKFFMLQAGPQALPLITLICISVGMILAYLGSVQLRQLGAQVYVANLVALGMVREMGPLMTAILIAGRTGAAYAAQLGTMRANEEIDALNTMGVSSMEFLVLPRLIALIFVIPIVCVYANVIGLTGGALVAAGMDVSFKQYILQTQGAVNWGDILSGLFKSLVFGVLIAIAGCQAGLNCGRSSIAVGIATTTAVVKAIIYIVLADAAFNVLYDKLGI